MPSPTLYPSDVQLPVGRDKTSGGEGPEGLTLQGQVLAVLTYHLNLGKPLLL